MNISSVSKFISAGVIAASLAVLPLAVPAQAQTENTAPDTTYNQRTDDVDTANTNDDFNWGWLGLLGLAGLAGLARKNHRETVHTRSMHEPDVSVRSGSDYRR
ncbi:MAG TPA: WGxxGxxG family protein [Stenomitos sp.]